MDHQSRPGVRAKKKARDRLIRLASAHPDWVLGYQDECWWSRLALPAMHAWSDDGPLRLVGREVPKGDTDPKALSCYGLLRADTGKMMLRFVTGRPVSDLWHTWLQRSGVLVLLLMMTIALSNDVARLMGLQ